MSPVEISLGEGTYQTEVHTGEACFGSQEAMQKISSRSHQSCSKAVPSGCGHLCIASWQQLALQLLTPFPPKGLQPILVASGSALWLDHQKPSTPPPRVTESKVTVSHQNKTKAFSAPEVIQTPVLWAQAQVLKGI